MVSLPTPILPSFTPAVSGVVRLGLVRAEPVSVGPSSPALVAEMDRTCEVLTREHGGKPPGSIEGLAPARQLYRSFGMDPTRTRPSSEALLRRVVKGKPLPRISSAVDLCNLCSLRFLLPLGLYDAGSIHGPVTLQRGAPGASYAGIRKDEVHLEGRPVLADEVGPFGNPTSDSLRTSVQPATRSLWMVIFAPHGFPIATLTAHVAEACRAVALHLAPAGETVVTDGQVEPQS